MSVTAVINSTDKKYEMTIPLELNPHKTIEEKRLALALSMRKF